MEKILIALNDQQVATVVLTQAGRVRPSITMSEINIGNIMLLEWEQPETKNCFDLRYKHIAKIYRYNYNKNTAEVIYTDQSVFRLNIKSL